MAILLSCPIKKGRTAIISAQKISFTPHPATPLSYDPTKVPKLSVPILPRRQITFLTRLESFKDGNPLNDVVLQVAGRSTKTEENGSSPYVGIPIGKVGFLISLPKTEEFLGKKMKITKTLAEGVTPIFSKIVQPTTTTEAPKLSFQINISGIGRITHVIEEEYPIYGKFLAFDAEYVDDGYYGQEGPGARDIRTGLLVAARQIGIEVSPGTYKLIQPEGITNTATWFGLFKLAKFGGLIFMRTDDVPNNVYSIAYSYYPSKAILLRCLKGSITVPKPYWSSTETNGSKTLVDSYDAIELSEGEYILFYEPNGVKPELGPKLVGFVDRYPKEDKIEGLTLEFDLAPHFENPTVSTITMAFGYGKSVKLEPLPEFGDEIFYLSDQRIYFKGIDILLEVVYRSPRYVHWLRDHHRCFLEPYLDDASVDKGTFQAAGAVYGKLIVIGLEDGTFGTGFILRQNRADYSLVNLIKAVSLRRYSQDGKSLFWNLIHCWKTYSTFHNYDQGGNTTGFANCPWRYMYAIISGFVKPSSILAWNGSSWDSISLPSGAYTWNNGYWATRYSGDSDYGPVYLFDRLIKFYSSWSNSITPRFSSWDRQPPYIYVYEVSDRDFVQGELTGYKASGVLSTAEYYEEPPAPNLEKITDYPTELEEYFTNVFEP